LFAVSDQSARIHELEQSQEDLRALPRLYLAVLKEEKDLFCA
jgi:hypothetical protein